MAELFDVCLSIPPGRESVKRVECAGVQRGIPVEQMRNETIPLLRLDQRARFWQYRSRCGAFVQAGEREGESDVRLRMGYT